MTGSSGNLPIYCLTPCYSDESGRLLRRAGLRRITVHDSRPTTLTLMEHTGVPISILSKWAGHYDSALTQKTLRPRER